MASIKKSKNYKILGTSLILIILAVGFVLITQQSQIPEKQFDEGNITENASNQTEVVIKTPEQAEKWIQEVNKRENITFTSSIQSTIENLPLTSKPTFKVGEKYTYKIKSPATPLPPSHYIKSNIVMEDYVYYNVSFTVDKKERINKTDYYVLSTKGSGKVIIGHAYRNTNEGAKITPLSNVPIPPLKWYINAENGKIFDETMEEIPDYYSSRIAIQLSKTYVSWMLKLSEGLKWTIKEEEKSTGAAGCISTGGESKCIVDKQYREHIREQSYEVESIEKINGRKCFKVNVREKSCTNGECKVLRRMIYWVDVEKRITVKYQLWYEGLSVIEIELIDYQK